MQNQFLGKYTRVESINYLDSSIFFAASASGKSYMAVIKPDVAFSDDCPNMEILKEMENFGPILDYTIKGLGNK